MAEVKKDSKGRILKTGERQRKDGRYEFRYTDSRGEQHSVYSWTLMPTDRTPKDKQAGASLREIEQRVRRDVEDGINNAKARRVTLNDMFDEYISTKTELRQSTRTNYIYMYTKYARDTIGKKNIATIKYSDIKKYYLSLINDLGFKPNSMEVMHTVIHPALEMAVRDNLIRVNPSDGVMAEIKRSHNWEKKKRHALTVEQQEALVKYVSSSATYRHWLPVITVMLGTGMRVGEVLGLCWDDCDFDKKIITVTHNLVYRQQDDGSCEFHINTPKTEAGKRTVPMLSEVKSALLEERLKQNFSYQESPIIDGYSGFIFRNRYGDVLSPHNVNRALKRIIRDYNIEETQIADAEHRDPILLPDFSAHNLRHTFCTRFCENETNLKVIQEIMGHADITTTMDVYNEATEAKKIESFESLEGKIRVG